MQDIIRIKGEPPEVEEIRMRILNAFDDLIFIEDGHKYFLNGNQIPSVTTIIGQFEHEFDTDAQAEKYAIEHGFTADHWKDEWRFKNLKATTTGTLVHEFGESMGWLKNGHPERITESCKCKYISEKGWLIPTRRKEEAVIKFWNDMPSSFHFVLAETKVYSNKNPNFQTKQQYCGTFDLLMYYKHPSDDSKSGLVIFDYKTNKELTKGYSRQNNKMLLEPFCDMYDEPLSAYTLQLSAYQIPLEDIGLKVLGRRVIWLKDDCSYEKIPLEDKTRELRETL